MRLVNILMIEDNPADVRLTKEALKQSKIIKSWNDVNDGVKALSFLRKEGIYKNKPNPDLIILDLNMPMKDGRELLAELKEDHNFKHIPVVILTASKAEDDIVNCYNSHANCYITKPVEFNQFIKFVKCIEDFWLSTVRLPPHKNFG